MTGATLADDLSGIIGGTAQPAGRKKRRAGVNSNGERTSACVFFGAERLKSLVKAAEATDGNLSHYVALAVDMSMIGKKRLTQLQALAKLRGTTPAAILSKLLDKELSSVGI